MSTAYELERAVFAPGLTIDEIRRARGDADAAWAAEAVAARDVRAREAADEAASKAQCGCDRCVASTRGQPTEWLAQHSWRPLHGRA